MDRIFWFGFVIALAEMLIYAWIVLTIFRWIF